MMKLNKFAQAVHENAVKHGWWDEERTFGEIIALCHSELSEALEELRTNRPMMYFVETNGFVVTDMSERKDEKPEGIAVELADCIIRVLDYFGKEELVARWAKEGYQMNMCNSDIGVLSAGAESSVLLPQPVSRDSIIMAPSARDMSFFHVFFFI